MLDVVTDYVTGRHTATKGGTGRAERILGVDERLDRLSVVVQALWSLLRDAGLTDEELLGRIHELDAVGDTQEEPAVCPECDSKIPLGFDHCQICGHVPDPAVSTTPDGTRDPH